MPKSFIAADQGQLTDGVEITTFVDDNGITRRIFNIDIGDFPAEKAVAMLTKFMEEYRNR